MEASKRLVANILYKDKNRKAEICTWSGFLVWSTYHLQLNNISLFYNLSNQIDVFALTIVNNIIHARKASKVHG